MALPLSHLFFANDSILFTLGQKVNYRKSNICFSTKNLPKLPRKLLKMLGIALKKDQGKNLETPSIHGRVNTNLYQHLLERTQIKLESRRMHYLSLVRRHTLVKSTITFIPYSTCKLLSYWKVSILKLIGELVDSYGETQLRGGKSV